MSNSTLPAPPESWPNGVSVGRILAGSATAIVLLFTSGAGSAEPWPASVGPPVAHGRHLRRLTNPGFAIGYDTHNRRPAWVAFKITPVRRFNHMHRPPFAPDPRLARATRKTCYDGEHVDRGHMAPNYAMRQLYGRSAQRASFYYSNIVAQRSRLNQLDWQRLEEIEIDDISQRHSPLWVIAGPIGATAGGCPAAFYRIWLAHDHDGRWAALAFRLPQHVRGDERLSRYIVSVDAIEAETGLDFFPALSDRVQKRVESAPAAASVFGFDRWACSAARYAEDWQDRNGIHLNYARCSSGRP